MKRKEDYEFNKSYFWILLSLILYACFYLVLVTSFREKMFDISITMLSAIPGLILVIATIMYVSATVKILEETKIQREKSFIEQVLKEILFPILDELESKKKSFSTRKIISFKNQEWDAYVTKRKIKEEIFVRYPEVNYRLFCKRYPELSRKIQKIDEKLTNFDKEISDFVLKINTEEFKKNWESIFKKYKEKKASKEDLLSLYHSSFSQINDAILFTIIHGERANVLPESFWELYNGELLKIHNQNLEKIKKIDKMMEEIKNVAEETKRFLLDLINSEQEKYGILGKVALD